MTRHQRIRRNTLRAIFMAIVILQDLVPFFGNIPLGPLSITTLHVTVILAAITLGPGEGAVIGGTWGILTWIRAFVAPTNPLVAIFPRIMIGVVAGYLFRLVVHYSHSQRLAAILAAAAGAITNTGLVLGLIYLFYRTPAVAHAYGVDVSHLLPALLAIMATNGLAELLLAVIIVPLIALPVLEVRRRLGQ